MLLEYSYDKCNVIIEDFKNSNIASLSITKTETNAFVMDYTLISELSEAKQTAVRQVLSESLEQRLEIVSVLNDFIEAQILDAVNSFEFRFNAINVRNKCELVYSFSFKSIPTDDTKPLLVELEKCLEHYDLLVTKLGVADCEIKDVFTRTASTRNKKYVPLTMKDFCDSIRTELAKG